MQRVPAACVRMCVSTHAQLLLSNMVWGIQAQFQGRMRCGRCSQVELVCCKCSGAKSSCVQPAASPAMTMAASAAVDMSRQCYSAALDVTVLISHSLVSSGWAQLRLPYSVPPLTSLSCPTRVALVLLQSPPQLLQRRDVQPVPASLRWHW